jgi:3-oxocholest-4-en-26-oate---CoA ligase
MNENLASLLEGVADAVTAAEAGRLAVVQGERERTWAELDRRAARLARWFAAAGVERGCRVGIGLYNSIEYIETLYAVLKLRAVPVNVNHRYREAELEQVLGYTGVVAVAAEHALIERITRVAPRLPALRALVSVGQAPAGGAPAGRAAPAAAGGTGGVPVAAIEAALAAPELPRQARSGADQIIVLTGGTTGSPKGVSWDHAGVIAVVSSVYRRSGLPVPATGTELVQAAAHAVATGSAPVMLPAAPLVHGTGFFFTLGNLLRGGCIVCVPGRSLDPAQVWREVQRRRVEEMAIVGDAFARPLLAELERASARGAPYDLGSLRRVLSSGVRWSPEVKRGFLRAGRMTLQDTIASTEGGPYGISLVGPGDQAVSPRFTLPPTARVLAPDGTDVVPGSGQVGELASSGPLPTGYLDDPDRTAAVFRVIDGVRYAVPGDAATVEADGTVTLLGRGSTVVNTGGEKVYVEEVEDALLTHPGVADAAVVGVADDRWGSRLAALVRAAPGSRPTAEELAAHVGRLLAGYKRPRQVVFVDAVERTAAGKIDRRWARQRARELADPDIGGGTG